MVKGLSSEASLSAALLESLCLEGELVPLRLAKAITIYLPDGRILIA